MTTAEPITHAERGAALAVDRFADDRRRGTVVGSTAAGGAIRRGRDVEGVLQVDHGALRIRTTVVPGWGREGVAYGPFEARPGRAFAVHLLNGHNTSESYVIEGMVRRVGRWAVGSETVPLWRRVLAYPLSRPREALPRKLRYWWANRPGTTGPEQLDNLAVGWFAHEVPDDPVGDGACFVVRATGPYNGELRTSVGGRPVAQFQGLQNLPVHYVSVQRERGAVLYASSDYEGARGLPGYPSLRPLAVDPRPFGLAHVGVWQAAQGQIGFSCDSRVYDVTVADVPTLASWSTSAVLADRFGREGPLAARSLEVGEVGWAAAGAAVVVEDGKAGAAVGAEGAGTVTADAGVRLGLAHVLVELGPDASGSVGLLWRHRSAEDHLRLVVGGGEVALEVVIEGAVARRRAEALSPWSGQIGLQVCDDGEAVVATLGDRQLFGGAVPERVHRDATGVGLLLAGGARASEFEVHPQQVEVPPVLRQGRRHIQLGRRLVLDERFRLPVDDLDGQAAGAFRWHRLMGSGRLGIPEPGVARFAASVEQPVPDRTCYVVDWSDPDHCDIEMEAATQAGEEGHRLRIGLVIWQDPANYVTMNAYLDHAYPAASASTFFVFRGFEDIYDAVWSNLGDKIAWGRQFSLRMVSDGAGYLVLVNGEPVLHRAFSDVHPSTERLALRKIGVVANWEWGHDTGSAITRVVARSR